MIRSTKSKKHLVGNKHGLNVIFNVPEEKTSSVNKCLEATCTSLNLNVAEIWEFVPIIGVSCPIDETDGESISDDTEAPLCVHVYSRFDEMDRYKAVIVWPWSQDEKDEHNEDTNIHKMSPQLCRMAYSRKRGNSQLWCYSSDTEFDRGIENPLNGNDVYEIAVAIPITAEYFGTVLKCCIVFFSVNTVKQCPGVELFLKHMSKACVLALTEDICDYSNEWENMRSRSTSESSDVLMFDDNPPPILRLPSCSADIDWNSLKDIEHLADGSKFTTFTAKYNGTTVVVKVVRKATRDMSAAMNDLENEMSLLLRCNHPHIVQLLGAGTVPERFLVVKMVDGGTLANWLKSGSPLCHSTKSNGTGLNVLPLSIILKFGRQLAETVQYLNGGGISDRTVIHGDLRPSNIGFCVEPNGEYYLKLLDLGLAKEIVLKDATTDHGDILSNSYDPTIAETLVGKMPLISGYLAPEVVEMRMFNEKADIFSFAMLMWSLMTMEQPYTDIHKDQFYAAVIRGNTRPCLPPNAPEELKQLLVSCWDEDPTQRPPICDIIDKLKSIDQKYAHDEVLRR